MKDNWVIPNAESVTIRPKKEVYPINLTCHDHKFIEQLEIPNAEYVRVKIKGCKYWARLYLPWISEENPE